MCDGKTIKTLSQIMWTTGTKPYNCSLISTLEAGHMYTHIHMQECTRAHMCIYTHTQEYITKTNSGTIIVKQLIIRKMPHITKCHKLMNFFQ